MLFNIQHSPVLSSICNVEFFLQFGGCGKPKISLDSVFKNPV